ncbi:MAG: hypothetical protein AB7O97_18250 [Planctomycetota bacterium]
MTHRRFAVLPFALLLLLTSCGALSYDLSAVPFDVSARPGADAGEEFTLTGKSVLWIHGLAGKDQPDVGALLRERCGDDCSGVTDFRVAVGASFHDWLLTHLTLGLVRMKTVTVSGRRHDRGGGSRVQGTR